MLKEITAVRSRSIRAMGAAWSRQTPTVGDM
jgi:hypothetical protein